MARPRILMLFLLWACVMGCSQRGSSEAVGFPTSDASTTQVVGAQTATSREVAASVEGSSVVPLVEGPGVDVVPQVGQAVLLFRSDAPDLDELFLAATIIEPHPELISRRQNEWMRYIFRLDREGTRVLIPLSVGRQGCNQLATASAEVVGDTVRFDVTVGPYDDLAAGCTNAGGVATAIVLEVEGGVLGRRIVDVGCPEPHEECGDANGVMGDELPLVNSALVGCVPPLYLPDEMHDRQPERHNLCDEQTLHDDFDGLLDDHWVVGD